MTESRLIYELSIKSIFMLRDEIEINCDIYQAYSKHNFSEGNSPLVISRKKSDIV